jgi:Eco57I restriction-modification methylase
MREAQKAYREAQQRQAAFRKLGMAGDDPEKIANDEKWLRLVDDLFEFRVLDPAMGSGHFLVEAVDFSTDHILDFLNGFPWNPVQAQLRQTRQTILTELDRQTVTIDDSALTDVNLLKRHILKRCIYGVDLNPMAVELAKVSLWLHCFTLGAPLSFLDHHLKCGNSLIGTTVQAVESELAARKTGYLGDLFGGPFQGLLGATALIEELSHLPDATVEQSRQSHSLFAEFEKEQAPYKAALDIWTSRFFGNKRADEYLTLVGSNLVDEIRTGGKRLSPEYQQVITRAASLQDAKRFFHWDLEFPEAFLDIRRKEWRPKEQQGFDVVIGNPPYDVLASEELGYDVSEDLQFYRDTQIFEPAIRGKTNLYKLFICRGVGLLSDGGRFSLIVPMPLLGDDQAAGVRRLLLDKTRLVAIEAFPQKDDSHNRVFPEAKLATTIFVTKSRPEDMPFTIRTHNGRIIEEGSSSLVVTPKQLLAFDPVNTIIPTCTQRDWDIAVRIVTNPDTKRLGDYCRAFQGEINETIDGKRGFISENSTDGPQILRGSTICLYVVRDPSQGEPIYLRKAKFLAGKPDSVKARHFEQRRVGWQESSPQNNFRRIIAALIPEGEFCNHLINYIPKKESTFDLGLVLALLNSRIMEWYFRLGSTNAHVSHYQIHNLPVPAILAPTGATSWRVSLAPQLGDLIESHFRASRSLPKDLPESLPDALAEMGHQITEIERKRELKNRSDRSHLAPECQPIQDAIDAVLFHCYGLTDDEARYIEERLKEML